MKKVGYKSYACQASAESSSVRHIHGITIGAYFLSMLIHRTCESSRATLIQFFEMRLNKHNTIMVIEIHAKLK